VTARARAGLAVALGLTVAGWLGAAAAPAWAHNVLLSTQPAAGSTVATVPDAVVLTFDRPALALGTAVEILGPAGDVASGPPALVDTTVREAVRAGAPAGAYTVRWRVTSADGHPVSGSFAFTALAGGGSAAATAGRPVPGSTHTAAGSSVLWWALWWVTAAAALLSVGLLANVARVRRHDGPAAARDAEGRLNE
jgi:methionine-rich copper-binding protein CopC